MANEVYVDRVWETSTTTGTGSYTLLGAVADYQTFAGVGNGNTCFYCASEAGVGWEVGIGTWSTGGTLARTAITASTNSNAAVSWSAGTRQIQLVRPAAYAPCGGVFGDGSSGALDFDGSSAVTGASRSGTTYTMTQDVWATDIDVASGVTVITAGFRIFWTGTLTNDGTIHNNGSNASGTTGGDAGIAGGSWGLPSIGAATAGGNGQTGTGVGTSATSVSNSAGGSGGSGGATATPTARAGGTSSASAPGADYSLPRFVPTAIAGTRIISAGANIGYGHGSGGGGGAGSLSTGTFTSGAGGGGAGGVFLFGRTLTNNGTISVNGGNGSNAATSVAGNHAGGGGGGGGGGTVIIVCVTRTGNTPTATGGTAGTGVASGTGSLGAASANGSDGLVILIPV